MASPTELRVERPLEGSARAKSDCRPPRPAIAGDMMDTSTSEMAWAIPDRAVTPVNPEEDASDADDDEEDDEDDT